ncbi:co-chaperone GroES [Planctomycetota bacterium]|nr:co-chaperone GroES [Planctomycetota bacterium]
MAKKTTVKPLDDRIILKPTVAETKTASGIFLPESATEKPMTGTVIAVGPGKLNEDGSRTDLTIKKGDVVLYGKYSGTEVDIDGVEHMIVRENELLGVIED